MQIPKKLYRYRAASTQDITNLSGAKLWFSSPSRFNDPFDCAYDVVLPRFSRSDCILLLGKVSDGKLNEANLKQYGDDFLHQQVLEGLRAAVASGLSGVDGVCCFSEIHNNLLMWGHYSAGHRGFCLEFDTTRDSLFQNAKQVQYSATLPTLGIETFTKGETGQIMKLLLTKAKCWEYEHEWRVLHQECEHEFGYERASLTGVYFGAKMPDAQVQMIASLLDKTDTKLYRMRRRESRFELFAEEFTFDRIDYRSTSETCQRESIESQH